MLLIRKSPLIDDAEISRPPANNVDTLLETRSDETLLVEIPDLDGILARTD
jgi:hypothetical protein